VELQSPIWDRLQVTNLALACYMIFAAMICDALDGRLARLARTTSDFGGQLDSLADVVSFGAAPAFIAVRLVIEVSRNYVGADPVVSPVAETAYGRFCWIAAAAYLACTALRLARFNVENVHDESAHMGFRGLPSPGAAGALISVVLLNQEVIPNISASLARRSDLLAAAVPWVAIALGLLMVSRVPYIHLMNRFFRGKKPFWMLVTGVLAVLAFWLWPELVLAIALCGYAASGPVLWLVRRGQHRFVPARTEESS